MRFPKDEDGKTLELLYKNGVDFNKKHQLDFFIVLENEKDAFELGRELEERNFMFTIEEDPETKEWVCCVTKEMYLDYDEIVSFQKELNKLSKPFNGYCDGWGTLVE
jgi:regulator of RNase E activity RraB